MGIVMTALALATTACDCLNTAFNCIGNCCGGTNTDPTPPGNINNQPIVNIYNNLGPTAAPPGQAAPPGPAAPPASAAPPAPSSAPPASAASGHGSTSSEAPSAEMVRVPLISVGTWGYPKCGKYFNFNDLNDIKTIKIVSNTAVIHSIEVQHIKNQELSRTGRVGREEGSSQEDKQSIEVQEVVLKDGEYINKVTGYYGPLADGTGALKSLTFHTNKDSNRPYGSGRLSLDSTFEVRGGKIVGFYGNAKKYIHAIGFHVLPVVDPVRRSSTVYVGPWGDPHYGEAFAHDNFNDIKAIRISSGRLIDSIQVQYIKGGEHVWTPKLGGGDPQGTPPRISETKELEDGEYITEVEGYYGTAYGQKHICYLSFVTNKHRPLGTYGTRHDGQNIKETTSFSVKGGKIVGFHGRATKKYIYSIGFYLSPI